MNRTTSLKSRLRDAASSPSAVTAAAAPSPAHPRRHRLALLAGLVDEPAHGYEPSSAWRHRQVEAEPGPVYPTLQMLEEAGFVSSSQQGDKKVYSITDAGRAELTAKTADAGGPPPWLDAESAGGHGELRKAIAQLVLAAKQVSMTDDAAQVQAAAAILDEARRSSTSVRRRLTTVRSGRLGLRPRPELRWRANVGVGLLWWTSPPLACSVNVGVQVLCRTQRRA
jgi:DNA-binding PadR family transcriptional regulator